MNQAAEFQLLSQLLSDVGVTVNGNGVGDMHIHDPALYQRIFKYGSLGLGEGYMDKQWDADALDDFFYKILWGRLDEKIKHNWRALAHIVINKLFNWQTKRHASTVAQKHYDLGNELFTRMLDSTMSYSCAYWGECDTLQQAQLNKLRLICDKLNLQPGMRVLEIGCGWGGFAKYAAEHYGVEVVGVTISTEQARYAKDYCKDFAVTILQQDYRDVGGLFDRVVSIGMFEHVGYKNYRHYFKKVYDSLKPCGLFLLHTIGNNITEVTSEPWIKKYIFPHGMLPSIKQIGATSEKLFIMEDWHNLSVNYDKTLMAWYDNFVANWSTLSDRYDERFYRMWTYYLQACAGAFRARWLQCWQIVFAKQGVPGGYRSIR
ncbi:MAG: cyclopropane-fatty-acyl-phospholipid synthase [Legionellales bacterium]|nr:cyclopropane-fatty-acyl-phospholipid synthase [Legionellales bacterium]|tara:strand:+ start:2152 stop:3273 length:1122 start_codon:yes stop_codon:yes gene_type:complete